MEADDLAGVLIEGWHYCRDGDEAVDFDLGAYTIQPAYEDTAFFVVSDAGERFLVTVAKVA